MARVLRSMVPVLAFALVGVVSCGPEAGDVAPLPTMRLLNTALLSELGPFHLRVFPKSSTQRCDVARGVVLVDGARNLTALPGRDVQPAERCGAMWASLASRYGSASPVDTCFTQQTAVSVPPGTYVVLVHGQGTFRRPTGETSSGIRGSGCVEVTLGEGATSSVTVRMVEQVDDRARCGDSMLDSNETCDLGMANGAAGSLCSAMCQTVERPVNNERAAMGVGNQRHAAVSWGPSLPLVVAFDVSDIPSEDVRARYFDPDGADITNVGALAQDVIIGGGPSQQSFPAVAPVASPRGYLAVWETLAGGASNALAESFDDQPPRDTTPPRYVSVPLAAAGTVRHDPAVAVAGSRALAVWREGSGTSGAVRAVGFAVTLPLTMPGASQMVVATATGAARVTATMDGGFVAAWSASGDIFVQKFNAMGVAQGTPQLANPISAQVQDSPAIAALPDGGVVVAWRDEAPDNADNDGSTVRWARLGANLQRMGNAHTAPTTTLGDQSHPTIAVGAGATPPVLIAWEDTPTGAIRGRLARPDGAELYSRIGGATADFAISGTAGPARHAPSAAAGGMSAPQFAVAWEGVDAVGAGVLVRVFPQ